MTFERFKALLDSAPELEAIELSNYGEIFLNPELPEILLYARQVGVELSASGGANLNHLAPGVAEALVRTEFHTLTCSIDGATQETYERYRVRGDLEKVLANIREINSWKAKLGTAKPILVWQFVVFGHNEHELSQARALATELGMRFVPKLSWDETFSPVRDRALVARETGLGASSRSEIDRRGGEPYKSDSLCRQLWTQPQINWNGDVLGCCVNFWSSYGNVFREGLYAGINGERLSYAREMLLGRAPVRSDIPCADCEHYRRMAVNERWLEPGSLE